MASVTFLVDEFTGTNSQVEVMIEEVAGGDLKVTLTKVSPNFMDLRGFFFNLKDNTLWNTLTATGSHVTDQNDDGSVDDLGGGANINPREFEVGVEIGGSGIGSDDIATTMFTISSSLRDLTLADLIGEKVGVRITSVGSSSHDRDGSSKLEGVVPVPPEPKGTIKIDKVTDPAGDQQTFNFDVSWSSTDVTLADGTAPANSGLLAKGSYTITEAMLPAGWKLENIMFSGDTDNGSTFDLATRKATVDLDPGENITVTYKNTKLGKIIVEKQTTPDGSTQSFEFDSSWGANFFLKDGQQSDSGFLSAGTYSISEINLPSGWNLSSAVASDGSPIDALSLQAGETIKVVFTNTQSGSIAWEKRNDLGNLLGGATFEISGNPTGTGPLTVVDNGANDADPDAGEILVTNVAAGTYTVTEKVAPAGHLIDTDPTRVVTVSAGEAAVIGTQGSNDTGSTDESDFHNVRLGSITVVKNTVPDGSTDFSFKTTGGLTPATFSLDDDSDPTLSNMKLFANLAPGTYSVTELAHAGFDLSNVQFSGSTGGNDSINGATATIHLDPGENITVTYTNTIQEPPCVEICKTAQLEKVWEKVWVPNSYGTGSTMKSVMKTYADYLFTIENCTKDGAPLELTKLVDEFDEYFANIEFLNLTPLAGDTHNIGFLDADETWVFRHRVEVPYGVKSIHNEATVEAKRAPTVIERISSDDEDYEDGDDGEYEDGDNGEALIATDSDTAWLNVEMWRKCGNIYKVWTDDSRVDRVLSLNLAEHDIIDLVGYKLEPGTLTCEVTEDRYGTHLVLKGETNHYKEGLETIAILQNFAARNDAALDMLGIDLSDGCSEAEECKLLGTLIAHDDYAAWVGTPASG